MVKKFLRKFVLPILAGLIKFIMWSLGGFISQYDRDEINALLEDGKRVQ